jgi:hypothetical protein
VFSSCLYSMTTVKACLAKKVYKTVLVMGKEIVVFRWLFFYQQHLKKLVSIYYKFGLLLRRPRSRRSRLTRPRSRDARRRTASEQCTPRSRTVNENTTNICAL